MIEVTGAGPVVFGVLQGSASYGVVCLTGVSPRGRLLTVEAGTVNREIVLQNDAVVGSVNARVSHYTTAAKALARADHGWLSSLITRRVPLQDALTALEPRDEDVKVVLDLT